MPRLCLSVVGMFRVDERQRDERPAVFLPSRQHGQFVKPRWLSMTCVTGARRVLRVPRLAELQARASDAARAPRGAAARSDSATCTTSRTSASGFGPKGELDAPRRAEEIGDDRIAAALHSLEQQRRAAALDHAAMDFRQFEIRIDFRFDSDEIVFAFEQIEK